MACDAYSEPSLEINTWNQKCYLPCSMSSIQLDGGPAVTLFWRCNGLPSATTHCPTRNAELEPKVAAGNLSLLSTCTKHTSSGNKLNMMQSIRRRVHNIGKLCDLQEQNPKSWRDDETTVPIPEHSVGDRRVLTKNRGNPGGYGYQLCIAYQEINSNSGLQLQYRTKLILKISMNKLWIQHRPRRLIRCQAKKSIRCPDSPVKGGLASWNFRPALLAWEYTKMRACGTN